MSINCGKEKIKYMKKIKLITGLTALTSIVASTPIIATSCSNNVSSSIFDGEYERDNVLSDNWVKKNLTIDGNSWSNGSDWSNEAYDSSTTINYVQSNINSSTLYANAIIYSIMLTLQNYPSQKDVTKIKISNSEIAYNIYDKTLIFNFQVDTYKDNAYTKAFKIATATPIKILRVGQISSDGKDYINFDLGSYYQTPYLGFGTMVSVYKDNNWLPWRELSTLDPDTRPYIDGVCTLAIPLSIAPQVKLKTLGNLSIRLFDDNDNEISAGSQITLTKGQIAIYSIYFFFDDIIALPPSNYTVTTSDPASVAAGSTFTSLFLLSSNTTGTSTITITCTDYSGASFAFDVKVE